MRRKPGLLARIILAGAWALLIANAAFAVGQIIIVRKLGTGNNPPQSPQIAALRAQYAHINLGAAVAIGLPLFVLLINTPGSHEPHPPGTCAKCGYNLTGNTSGACPECGQKPSPPAAAHIQGGNNDHSEEQPV